MTQRRDYRFARRPKWLAGHVIALLAVVVFVNMGFWQMRRLSDRQEFNAILMDRTTVGEVALDDALAQFGPSQDSLELRVVVAAGEYRPAEEVILIAKSYNGLSGHQVLTPLYLGDGRAVVVDRGWVSIDLDQPGMVAFAPPEGLVEVSGVLRKTEVRGSVGPVTPAEGILTQIARPNLDRLDSQVEADLLPVYIQLLNQNPSQPGDYPALVPLPQPSEGSHRGYAVQWFLFAAVTVVGYPILLRRTAEEAPEGVV